MIGRNRTQEAKIKIGKILHTLNLCWTTGLLMSSFGGRGNEDLTSAGMEKFLAEPNSLATQRIAR